MSKTTVIKYKDGSFGGAEVMINTHDFDSELHEYISGEEPVQKATLEPAEIEKLTKDIAERDEYIEALEAKLAEQKAPADKTAKTK